MPWRVHRVRGRAAPCALINRLDDCGSGNIYIDGKEITYGMSRELRNKGGLYVSGGGPFFEGTVMENVLYGLCIRGGLEVGTRAHRALELLKQVGVVSWNWCTAMWNLCRGGRSSGSIWPGPWPQPLISSLMDEPPSSLDPAATRTIENLIQELNAQGRTFVSATAWSRLNGWLRPCASAGRGAAECLWPGSTRELFAAREITNPGLTNGKEDGDD